MGGRFDGDPVLIKKLETVWAGGDGSLKSVSDSSFKSVSSWTSGKDIVVPGRDEFR